MAYWYAAGQGSGAAKQVTFLMDSDSDKADLPTSQNNGSYQGDDVSYLSCGRGSVALSIESGKIYMLNSDDEWVAIGG